MNVFSPRPEPFTTPLSIYPTKPKCIRFLFRKNVTNFGDIGKTGDQTEARFHPTMVKPRGIARHFCDRQSLNFKIILSRHSARSTCKTVCVTTTPQARCAIANGILLGFKEARASAIEAVKPSLQPAKTTASVRIVFWRVRTEGRGRRAQTSIRGLRNLPQYAASNKTRLTDKIRRSLSPETRLLVSPLQPLTVMVRWLGHLPVKLNGALCA